MKETGKKILAAACLFLAALPAAGEAAMPSRAEFEAFSKRQHQRMENFQRQQRAMEARVTNPGGGQGGATYGQILGDLMEKSTRPKLNVDASHVAMFQGHRYFLYSGVCKTWEEARAHCENFGGHLVTIGSEEENEFLCRYVMNLLMVTPNLKYTEAFIGLSRTEVGTWEWVDGTPVTFTNWAEKEPSAKEAKKYARIGEMKTGRSRIFGFGSMPWYADKFKKDSAFICEWDTDEDWELAKLYMEENF